MAILQDTGKLGCWKWEGLYVVAHNFFRLPVSKSSFGQQINPTVSGFLGLSMREGNQVY